MRAIKFRAKSKEDKEFVYGYYFKTEDKHYILQQMLGGLQKFEVIPETIGQFTGIYDKHGNDIYEGDILKDKGEYATPKKVIFKGGSFQYKYEDSVFELLRKWNVLVYELEIIGNIHENPELLER